MLLHDIPKEITHPILPDWMEGLRVFLAVNPNNKLRIDSNFLVEFTWDNYSWHAFPRENMAGWLTENDFAEMRNEPWPWDRIEFVP